MMPSGNSRVVENLTRNADAGQQSHGFDMIAVGLQKCTDRIFGQRQLAVRKKSGRCDNFWRQLPEFFDMAGRCCGIVRIAEHPVERLELDPARG